ncbi:MAG: hypothetical protein M1479_04770 [Actinobacteria bacterium]|nr:hypothetical protein [Cyanobacteriota bacterium]MCL5771571.1 hypothetical protein [Actinomycetota bacterium]
MASDFELSIANLSFLSDTSSFLLQTSIKNSALDDFIKNSIPKKDKEWISDLKSWEINNKWIFEIANICIKSFDQVFFDKGDEVLLDLKDDKSYKKFKQMVEEIDF